MLDYPIMVSPDNNLDSASGSDVQPDKSGKTSKKPFSKLFSRDELLHYGIAALVYIGLGVLLKGIVLNFVVGPAFIVLWIWFVPILLDKWKDRRR